MDGILERLCELEHEDTTTASHRAEVVAEAKALWRTLETLLATMHPQEMSVGDATFTMLLACVRAVLRDPENWRVHAMDKHDRGGVFEFVNRVLVKLGCRGEREREAIANDSVVELLGASMQHQRDSTVASSAVLQVLQTLALDALNRPTLDACKTLPLALALMKAHPRDEHVQVFGCKFLQLMVYDEACKQKLVHIGALAVALDALRQFPSDPHVATSALDFVYFLSAETTETSDSSTGKCNDTVATESSCAAAVDDIVTCVADAMRAHSDVHDVQTNGMAILHCVAAHPYAKQSMCAANVWELVLRVICASSGGSSNDEATSDALDVSHALLSDATVVDTVASALDAPSSLNDCTTHTTVRSTLEALRATLASVDRTDMKHDDVQFITSMLERLLHPTPVSLSSSSSPLPEVDAVYETDVISPTEPTAAATTLQLDDEPSCDNRLFLSLLSNDDSNRHSVARPPRSNRAHSIYYEANDPDDEMPLATPTVAAPLPIERKLFANRTQLLRPSSSRSVHSSSTDADDSPLLSPSNEELHPSSTLHELASDRDYEAQHEQQTERDDAMWFLDDLARDSDAGGYFDTFLRDADDRFQPRLHASDAARLSATAPALSPPQHDSVAALVRSTVSAATRAAESTAATRHSGGDRESNGSEQRAAAPTRSSGDSNSRGTIHTTTATPALASSSSRYNTAAIDSSNATWRAKYEQSAAHVQALEAECDSLHENWTIVARRAQEQTKLLALQRSRMSDQHDTHAHVLARMQTLEAALATATHQLAVERERRHAEVAQCERVTRALHDAQQTIKALTTSQTHTARELQHREKLRVDSQHRTSAVKQQQQRIELERDDAVLQARTIRYEKAELCRKLEECQCEALEALRMREEDVDAPRPRVFTTVLGRSISRSSSPVKSSTRSRSATTTPTASTGGGARRSLAAWSGSDANGSSSAAMANALLQQQRSRVATVQPIDTTALSSASFSSYSSRSSRSPRKLSAYHSSVDDTSAIESADPATLERDDIALSLQAIFDSLNTSIDGTGVHVATVRRFFLESGLVAPPSVVAADVDVILANVLSQAQEHRRKTVVRRDYASPQSASSASLTPTTSMNDARKYRYFDQDAFNEAVTLVGMRRFPRLGVKRMLQTVVVEFLHPIQHRMRAASMLVSPTSSNSYAPAGTSSLQRSHSVLSPASGSFCSSPDAIRSPSSFSGSCNSVLRAILNGLALHISRDDADDNDVATSNSSRGGGRRHPSENVVFAMLEMHTILAREQRPLGTICGYYSTVHLHHHHANNNNNTRDELLGVSFEFVLSFAMDFEIVPAFMDRVSLKHLYAECATLVKSYVALDRRVPHAMAATTTTDAETLKQVAFMLVIARIAIALFGAKVDYETPEKQITGMLQWLDNSGGRDKLTRKTMLPLVIKFSRQLYALRI